MMTTIKEVREQDIKMNWISIELTVPSDEVLIWAGGRCIVACLVEGVSSGEKWRVFMDARTDDLLPWPTHWMKLPVAPDG